MSAISCRAPDRCRTMPRVQYPTRLARSTKPFVFVHIVPQLCVFVLEPSLIKDQRSVYRIESNRIPDGRGAVHPYEHGCGACHSAITIKIRKNLALPKPRLPLARNKNACKSPECCKKCREMACVTATKVPWASTKNFKPKAI